MGDYHLSHAQLRLNQLFSDKQQFQTPITRLLLVSLLWYLRHTFSYAMDNINLISNTNQRMVDIV